MSVKNHFPRWEASKGLNASENCIAVNIQQSALLRDEDCASKSRYICEVWYKVDV